MSMTIESSGRRVSMESYEHSHHRSSSHNQVLVGHPNPELIELLSWALAVGCIIAAGLCYWFCCRRRSISPGGIIRVPQTAMQPVGAQTTTMTSIDTGASAYHPLTTPYPSSAGNFCPTSVPNTSSIATPYPTTMPMPNNEPCANVQSAMLFRALPPTYNQAMTHNVMPYSNTSY